jgi:hypothetical protein
VSGKTFVRWRSTEPREQRVFPPLPADHPAVSEPCPGACGEPLGCGLPVQLLVIGPTDGEDYRAHREGRWYSALALLFHAACLGTELPA